MRQKAEEKNNEERMHTAFIAVLAKKKKFYELYIEQKEGLLDVRNNERKEKEELRAKRKGRLIIVFSSFLRFSYIGYRANAKNIEKNPLAQCHQCL